MAYYGESLNSFKPSHSFLEIDQSFDVVNQFSEFSGNVIDSSNLGFIGCSNENFNLPLLDNFFGFWPLECLKPAMDHTMVACVEKQRDGGNKRKAESVSVTHYGSSSMTPSETERKNGLGSVKRMKGSLKEVDKGKEVVHVRARRGQATDSHSLAERVRRKKINEKMKFLQDIVPGCYKTMGMAGVLDEIINYVQSLQNQVEFLSMKLSAASSFCDFILETTTTWQNKKYFQGWVMPTRAKRWRD